jgi:hypothetical protein
MSDDRKYRHRGYMDSGGSEPRGRSGSGSGPRPPRDESGAPRGRGIDLNKAVVFPCRACGEKRRDLDEIGNDSSCAKCGAPLHACRQCTYFDTAARFQCTQPIPARIPSKTAANTCTFYAPARSFDLTGARATETPDDARSAFDNLFKK